MWSAIICFYLNIISVALVLIVYWVKYLGWELLLCEMNHDFTTEKELKTLFLLDEILKRQDLNLTFSEITRK